MIFITSKSARLKSLETTPRNVERGMFVLSLPRTRAEGEAFADGVTSLRSFTDDTNLMENPKRGARADEVDPIESLGIFNRLNEHHGLHEILLPAAINLLDFPQFVLAKPEWCTLRYFCSCSGVKPFPT